MSILESNQRYRDFEEKGSLYRISIFEAPPNIPKYRLFKMVLDGDVQPEETDDRLVERLKHITGRSTNL
jgi:hypothetical protein